jgi:hypothetical protein
MEAALPSNHPLLPASGNQYRRSKIHNQRSFSRAPILVLALNKNAKDGEHLDVAPKEGRAFERMIFPLSFSDWMVLPAVPNHCCFSVLFASFVDRTH